MKHFQISIQNRKSLTPSAKRFFTSVIDICLQFVPIFLALHRGLFYIKGRRYQISKRIFGINYVLVRYWLQQNHSVTGYRILGYITLIQALISLAFCIRTKAILLRGTNKRPGGLVAIKSSSSKTCILCLDIRKNATALACGHIFCWPCILDWLGQREDCPVCRQITKPSHCIFLANYQNV